MKIRKGTVQDLPAIHGLVGELARYVDCLDQFTATIDDYRSDFAAGFFRALVAENGEDEVVGMVLYYHAYSTWKGRMIYLEDFVVARAYRRRGVGQLLWDALKEEGRAQGCQLLKWQIAGHNTEALKFYAAQHADIDETWLNGKIQL